MKYRKLTPAERGLAPRSAQFTERQREIYDRAYGKGADPRQGLPTTVWLGAW